MLAAYEDKSAYAQCVFAYASGPDDAEPTTFVGKTHGKIVPRADRRISGGIQCSNPTDTT